MSSFADTNLERLVSFLEIRTSGTSYPGKEMQLSPEEMKLLRKFLLVLKNTHYEETEEAKDIPKSEPVAAQSAATLVRRSAVSFEETEKSNPGEKDVYQQLYVGFKDVHGKLLSLENTISRLGGAGDILNGIRQLRASLLLAMFNFSESRTRVYYYNLPEYGRVFRSFSDAKFQAGLISEGVLALRCAFDELGTVRGCHFVLLCDALDIVWYRTGHIIDNIMRFKCAGGKAKDLATEHFFRDLSRDMDSVSREITAMIEKDIPNLRTAEQRLTAKYTSMSTMATFFSSITVTAIQMSSTMTGNELKDAVNTIWFTSLVFSIGSVIISLLSLSWFQSLIPMRVCEKKMLKTRVIFLLRIGPLMLMIAAAATFMIGLAVFVNSSGQARSTSIVTSSFIVLLSVILIFLAIYFAILYKADAAARLWVDVTRFVSSQIRVAILLRSKVTRLAKLRQDAATENVAPIRDLDEVRVEEFLSKSDSDDHHPLLYPGKIQVSLCDFDGPLAVANSEISSLKIYKHFNDSSPFSDSSAYNSYPVEPPLREIKQLLWSPDKQNLLIRMENSLSLWSEEDCVRNPLFTSLDSIKDTIRASIWTKDSHILVIQSQSLTRIADKPKPTPISVFIIAAQLLDDDHLVGIADVYADGICIRKLLGMYHA
ncbi:hypothetical protein EW145_g5371 [Phellinidium pouzarii]|uniref:Uncharacterized protein n=1 Tax=Phellinidium pouzarii TaxID=167371 RepID=A0A4S4L062_9AGAM|nr:hypothetical protein EW145_g5371 [Phellinidium pouzarii]